MPTDATGQPGKAILFVCLGNICRSPLAEGALRREAARQGLSLTVDSAGTGDWHLGHAPDERAQRAARRHGFDISHLVARQVTPGDFARFDVIYALDRQNLRDLEDLAPAGHRARLCLLSDEIPGRAGGDVSDPYYAKDEKAFDATVADVETAARTIVRRLLSGSDRQGRV